MHVTNGRLAAYLGVLSNYTLEATKPLSPASRLAWLGITHLAHSQPTGRVQGRVQDLCGTLELSDRAFKTAVEELQTAGLLQRIERKTGLGAHSFEYQAIVPEAVGQATGGESRHERVIEVLYTQHPFKSQKLNVNQRVLLIAVLVIINDFSLIMEPQSEELSRLTGIPRRNILSNLLKLKEKGLLKPIKVGSKGVGTRKKQLSIWAYALSDLVIPKQTLLVFSGRPTHELQAVALLMNKQELQPKLQKLDKIHDKQFLGWSCYAVSAHITTPFPTVPDQIRELLLETIDATISAWKCLEASGLLNHFNLIWQLAAVRMLRKSYADEVPSPYEYIESSDTQRMIKMLVKWVPIAMRHQESISRLLLPLCLMRATSLKNSLEGFLGGQDKRLAIRGRNFLIQHIKSMLAISVEGEIIQGELNPIVLSGEADYRVRNQKNNIDESPLTSE